MRDGSAQRASGDDEGIAEEGQRPTLRVLQGRVGVRYPDLPDCGKTTAGPCRQRTCRHHNAYSEPGQHIGRMEAAREASGVVAGCSIDLAGDGPRTLEEVGELLGLTRERVRQIEVEAFKKIRRDHPDFVDFAERGEIRAQRARVSAIDRGDATRIAKRRAWREAKQRKAELQRQWRAALPPMPRIAPLPRPHFCPNCKRAFGTATAMEVHQCR